MDKKYSSGNHNLSSNYDLFSYTLNTNETNNKLIYSTKLFPYSNFRYLDFSLVFENTTLNSYKFNIYYSFVLSNGVYKIYDANSDYEEAILYETTSNYVSYKSMSYILYVYQNNPSSDYKLVDLRTNTEYLFLNNNYPYRINYYDGKEVNIIFSNNKIYQISCNEELITFLYSGSTIEATLIRYFNNNEILSSQTLIYLNNTNNTKLFYYVFEYDYDDENYGAVLGKKFDLLYSSNILSITNIKDNTSVKFYYINGLFTKIEHDNGNIHETNISYNSNITTITRNDDTSKSYYNSDDMIIYLTKNDKYIKYYKYNDDYLLEYESEYLKNDTLLTTNILGFQETSYNSFSVLSDTTQTIPQLLNDFIDTNDIFHITGYGELSYDLNVFGEEISLLFFSKISSGTINLELDFYGDNYCHTTVNKQIINSSDFIPYVIGVKPDYVFDKIRIKIIINGDAYINTPKLSKTHLGIYYEYDTNYNFISIINTNDKILFTYSNNLISSITSKEITRVLTRDNHGNITNDNINGFILERTYDNKNRILTESSDDGLIEYSYSEEIVDHIYYYIITLERDGISYVNKYDNCLREMVSYETYDIDYEVISNVKSKSYQDIKLRYINESPNGVTLTYNSSDRLTSIYDGLNAIYSFIWQNNKINDIKYNNSYYIDKKTYDTRDRVITQEFNGIYSYSFYNNPKKIDISYNNVPKYELNFNNYDLLTSDGYNNYEYDSNDSINKNTILDYEFNYYKNDIGYNDTTANIYNYFYTTSINGDGRLKDDYYYSNITFNNDPLVKSVNSSNTTIIKCDDKYYPLSSSLLSINGDSPKIVSKQDYRLFYYDKDINNYATLLYGTKIVYETNILNIGQIEFDFKIENRILNQLLIRLKSNYRDIIIYKEINYQKLAIKVNNTLYIEDYFINSNIWYKLHIDLNVSSISIKIKTLTSSTYDVFTYYYTTYQDDTNLDIQFGKTSNSNDLMTTYGLIRNLFYSHELSNRNYINLYKTDLMYKNNEIKNSEIKINDNQVLNIERTISQNCTCPHNSSITTFTKRSIIINNGTYILDTYLYGTLVYENYVKLDNQQYYSYRYDKKKRLIQESVYSNYLLYGINYSYDNYGNITSWSQGTGFSPTIRVTYTYDNQYKMKLNSISIREGFVTNYYSITYDNVTGLLPISFMGNSYSYEGYNLVSFNNYHYTYNVYGKRIRKYKTNLSLDIYYYYDKNNNLILEDRGSYRLKYLYDCSNNLYGFIYDNTNSTFNNVLYLYIKDDMGTIMGIVDSAGNLVGKYNYNAYGYIFSIDTISDLLGVMDKNPMRYKSYYYDTESNMYYLNTRYYHPLLARFITPDRFENVDVYNYRSFNLYTYCFNNPTSYIDSDGKSAVFLTILVVGALAATAHDVTQIVTGKVKTSDENPGKIENSYLIFTPWVQLAYSIYLNHINTDTRDYFIGSSSAIQYEWLGHNLAYWYYFCKGNEEKKEEAKDADIGPTIFDDKNHGFASAFMKASYGLLNTPIFIIEAFIKKINEG